MSKQKIEKTTNQQVVEVATVLGAWVLTAAALLSSSEKLMHGVSHGDKAHESDDHSIVVYEQPEAVRAEGARETARLPEEYDVGLRMPYVSGA